MSGQPHAPVTLVTGHTLAHVWTTRIPEVLLARDDAASGYGRWMLLHRPTAALVGGYRRRRDALAAVDRLVTLPPLVWQGTDRLAVGRRLERVADRVHEGHLGCLLQPGHVLRPGDDRICAGGGA